MASHRLPPDVERGIPFLLVHWRNGTGRPNPRLFGDLPVDMIDLGRDPPESWADWYILGDSHPIPRAHERAATLISEWLRTEPGLGPVR